MLDTNGRAERIHRWLRRLGLPYYIPSALVFDLLGDRWTARRRALMTALPIVAAGAVVTGFAIAHGQHFRPNRAQIAGDLRPWMAAESVFSIGVVVWLEMIRHFEAGIGRAVLHRTSRGVARPVSVVVGRVTLIGLGLAAAAQLVTGVLLFVGGVDLLSWMFAANCVLAWLLAGWQLVRTVSRPSLAADELTTAVDERLRSADVVKAFIPICLSTLTVNFVAISFPSVFPLGGIAAIVAVSLIGQGRPRLRWGARLHPGAPMIHRSETGTR